MEFETASANRLPSAARFQDNFFNATSKADIHAYAQRNRRSDPTSEIIEQDNAIKRYYSKLASKRKKKGIVSNGTRSNTGIAIRHLARYYKAEITNHFVSDLLTAYTNGTQEYKDKFLNVIEDFSNLSTNGESLKARRSAANIIKGIFKANHQRPEVFVDSHFSIKTQRITEGVLANIKQLQDHET